MRVALTGLSGRRRPTNLQRKSRLAAISWSYKQPKTHLEVGTKKPGRSGTPSSSTSNTIENRSRTDCEVARSREMVFSKVTLQQHPPCFDSAAPMLNCPGNKQGLV